MKLVFTTLHKGMKRDSFSCGEPALDAYLRHQARQDMERGFATVIVATDEVVQDTVIGFYTLNAASVLLAEIPEALQKKMPRYPTVPAVLLGRLAVALDYQRQNMGTLLLVDALTRACRNELGWALFCVEAKNHNIAGFYQKMMFQPFQDRPHSLWMTRKQAEVIITALS